MENGFQAIVELEYKSQMAQVSDTLPAISKDKDYVVQYVGIWKAIVGKVLEMNAKTVLEFGTREGYSTRLFAKALKQTGGVITTVDLNDPKNPDDFKGYDNIQLIKSRIEDLKFDHPVDILYIDDWHNGYHLYWELNQFAHLAKVVMIHDVMLDKKLMEAIEEWCRHNWVIWTVYPVNGCGLAVLEIERSMGWYK